MFVDIIIPTYKRYGILQETLSAVQQQSHPHWTCWVAEDGESQETLEAVNPFLPDNRFKYLPGEHWGSPSRPRNRAITASSAPLIAFLDDDDIWMPDKLEVQVNFMREHPECMILGCNAYRWPEQTGRNDNLQLYFKRSSFSGKIPYSRMVQENHLILSSVIIRRDAIGKAGLFNENLPSCALMAEDYEFWLRVAATGDIWSLSHPYMYYRISPATYYKNLDRHEKYHSKMVILEKALQGDGITPSPLDLQGNKLRRASALRELNFCKKGPRFLGRLRHETFMKLRSIICADV